MSEFAQTDAPTEYRLATLGELAGDKQVGGSHWRASPLLMWAGVLLFGAMAYHYAFELQPLSRIAQFKRAVAESDKDWTKLEPKIKALGFNPRSSPHRHRLVGVELCPIQSVIKAKLENYTWRIPLVRQLPNLICTQHAVITLAADLKTIEKVRY